jgi:hypothetical protein
MALAAVMPDPFSCLGKRHHHVVDVFLPAALPATAFSNQHALGFATREFEHLVGDEIVEEDDIGRLKCAHGLESQEFGISGTSADKGDVTDARWSRRNPACVTEKLGLRYCIRLVTKGAVDETLPEGTTLAARLKPFVDRLAHGLGNARPAL